MENEDPISIQTIIDKVKSGEKISKAEEIKYMIEVCNFTKDQAERIIAINDNKNPNLILDHRLSDGVPNLL